MRLIELHEVRKRARVLRDINFRHPGHYAALAEGMEVAIERRLDETGIGWSEPLKFGVPDAVREYKLRCRCSGPHCAHNATLDREQAERYFLLDTITEADIDFVEGR